jgi:hypothetical protein
MMMARMIGMSLSSMLLMMMKKCTVWGCNLCTIVPTVHVGVVVEEEDSVDSLLVHFDPPSHSAVADAAAAQHHNKHHVHNIYPTSAEHVHYVSTSMKQSIVSMVPRLPQC